MDIPLLDICKRIILWYYPIWLILGFLGSYVMNLLNWRTKHTLLSGFLSGQFGFLILLIAMLAALWVLKPKRLCARLIAMGAVLLILMGVFYMLDSARFHYVPVPFFGPSFATQTFLFWLTSGVYIIWFYFVAENSLSTEKNLIKEKTKRIFQEKRLMENRLNLLQARIEPQFLFNTMNRIFELLDTDLSKAKTMQTAFIQYLRATLKKTRNQGATVEQEMELIRSFMEIFKVIMGQRLSYNIDTDPETKGLPLPSMLIQPIIENRIKQGIEPKTEGGKIDISIGKMGGRLNITISDTGSGSVDKKMPGSSLLDVEERIHALFGQEGRMIVQDNFESRHEIILTIPYA